MSGADDHQQTLQELGRHIRARRQRAQLTLKALADRSGVSERFLSDVEGGKGNISVAKLCAVATALGATLPELFAGESESPEQRLKGLTHSLARLTAEELEETSRWVQARFAQQSGRRALALLGLRGAGKSTVGAAVAKRLGWSFIELDALVEAAAGLTLGELFELHGEGYYRRLEQAVLAKVLAQTTRAVLATGGGIVQNREAFELLEARCVTVWLKATPEQHWQRVILQGDVRPMKDKPHARAELQALLKAREPLYSKAHHLVDTSALTLREAVSEVAAFAVARSPRRKPRAAV